MKHEDYGSYNPNNEDLVKAYATIVFDNGRMISHVREGGKSTGTGRNFRVVKQIFQARMADLLCKTVKIVALAMLSLMAYPLLPSRGAQTPGG